MNFEEIKASQIRTIPANFQTREENGDLIIEGYFAVFDKPYFYSDEVFETVDPGAFANTLSADIRALTNHVHHLVLGRNKSNTLTLREDDLGLFGQIKVNPKDRDAVNLYERVKRGDVDQCSFGFDIIREQTDLLEDGRVHVRIQEARLYEVSVVTFPAYEDTGVVAREKNAKEAKAKAGAAWREAMIKKLKGEQ